MNEESVFYRRNLPHYQPPYATYFITFRLAGSLPAEVIIKLKEEYTAFEQQLHRIQNPEEKENKLRSHHKHYFVRFDEFLDKHSHGPTWLKDERIAQLVADAIQHRDGKEYELLTYSIMPNHVHLVISSPDNVARTSVRALQGNRTEVRSTAPYADYKLATILRELKGSTARGANLILQRSGAFWQHESYDHVIRDGKELDKIIVYVLNNPVCARLADDWKKWRWSYLRVGLGEDI